MDIIYSVAAPLVTVVVTTYNYGQYLPVAIASISKQTYPNIEIIVVDDGSTDDTKNILPDYPEIKYYYQSNRGISSARNTGIAKSAGDFLVFLDADDWLEDNALEKQAAILIAEPELAFVSGNYFFLRAGSQQASPVTVQVNGHHYENLLQRNYIGMHAAVMYRRWVFDEFGFDESLQSCEDYDLYLRIARKYPVYHQQQFIATYNFHQNGLSHNYEVMKNTVYEVINKQQPYLKNVRELQAFRKGINQWKQYYCLQRYHEYAGKKAFAVLKSRADLFIFLRYDRSLLLTLLTADAKRLFASNGNKKL